MMVAAAVVWIGLCIAAALFTGIGLGRRWEGQRKDDELRDYLLAEADRDIARMKPLGRITAPTRFALPVKWQS